MGVARSIGKWILRLGLLAVGLGILSWAAVHLSRAYYGRQARQPTSAFIVEGAPLIALTHARIIDGTGSPAQSNQTLILNNGFIADVGPSSSVSIPSGARVIDLSGKSVFPGLVMLHEHLFTVSPDSTPKHLVAVEQPVSFPLMYLAGGVTTLKTTGSMDAQADLAIKRAIDSGQQPGPDMFLTAPYLEAAPLLIAAMHALSTPAEARRAVDDGAAMGLTSFKAYMHLSPEELKAAIEEAHSKGLKITGHLCSVGFTEAADLGIDGLEHGLFVDAEFFPGKQAGLCPPDDRAVLKDINERLDVKSPEVQQLVRHLVERHVAVISTMAVFADVTDDAQPMSALEAREMRALSFKSALIYRILRRFILPGLVMHHLMPKAMQFEHDFAAAGGLLLAGSDPTGDGGTLAGYADQREIELLVKEGFTPVEAIHIATANGAEFLGQSARIGTIAKGKQADLVVVTGDPSTNISDIRNVELVFRRGVGYDSPKMFAAVKGLVGVE
jgi:imidazolonepropionase-like amidohydrolase